MNDLITNVQKAKADLANYLINEIERVAIQSGIDTIEMIPDPHYKHLVIMKKGIDASNQLINDLFEIWLNHIDRAGFSHNWNRRDGWN